MSEKDEEVKRQRTLTEKGETLFEENRQKLSILVDRNEERLKDGINHAKSVDPRDRLTATECVSGMRSAYNDYTRSYNQYIDFLSRVSTSKSKEELNSCRANHELIMSEYKQAKEKLCDITGTSVSSRTSSVKKAELARIKLQQVKKEAEISKRMAAYEEEQKLAMASLEEEQRMAELKTKLKTDRLRQEFELNMTILQEEKVTAAIQAEAEAECGSAASDQTPHIDVPSVNSHDKVEEYVSALSTEPDITYNKTKQSHIKLQTVDNLTTETLTTFLLRKDIMPQRLKRFNGKPQCFGIWRETFKSVMTELKASPAEEIEFLINNLTDEARQWSENIRAANPYSSSRALELMWNRLEHWYGSPERIEDSIKNRVDKFPHLTNKDNRKLFDLYDLLAEIESLKGNPKFACQFAVYDSSAGVNGFVQKLPYGLQQKWMSRATKYKTDHDVIFPPFKVFVKFIHELASMRNDPAFQFDVPSHRNESAMRQKAKVSTKMTGVTENAPDKDKQIGRCPIHKANHGLSECKAFMNKSWEERRDLVREKGLCYRCLVSSDHVSARCTANITCDVCKKKNHRTIMHRYAIGPQPVYNNGGERNTETVSANCTSLCGRDFMGRSCGKIVLVDITYDEHTTEQVYAIIDDQSNRSLIAPELCNKLNVSGKLSQYTLASCSGSTTMAGRRVSGLTVTSIDGATTLKLPELIECDSIPQNVSEIPTPEVANKFPHLKRLTTELPKLERGCGIHLLIGRDLPAAHHIQNQVLGPPEAPFALKLPLGWVIIGEVCLGQIHRPDTVSAYYTNIDGSGRCTIFDLCDSHITIKDSVVPRIDIFRKSPEDNKVGLSVDDRDFLKIMDQEFSKDQSGLWTAPLPFKPERPVLPDNR